VQFGINGTPEVARAWSESRVPSDPPARPVERGDLILVFHGPEHELGSWVWIQTGTETSMINRNGPAPFGRVVEGLEILDRLDRTHFQQPGNVVKVINIVQKKGNEAALRKFPSLDAINRAILLDRAVTGPPTLPIREAEIISDLPADTARVHIYRTDALRWNFTLRVDGQGRAVLKPGTFFTVDLPAGMHELSTWVKFKAFATGLMDKALAGSSKLSLNLESGHAYYISSSVFTSTPPKLILEQVVKDFGEKEIANLTPAKTLEPVKSSEPLESEYEME
jgi:hypothetical protein